ncbi:hypothetical protein WMY93_003320 [Mugilogobius chulae]|uniref:Uncharacterized protein n=1 Tax=Mugilogobius chulae TaxID=88201 RepID=A0AAW0PZ84_9GOBI
MKRRKEYTEAKRVLKEKSVRFQTPFPAKLRVFYEGETRTYSTAAEATKDMVTRGFQVRIVRPADDPLEKLTRQMWQSAPGGSRPDQDSPALRGPTRRGSRDYWSHLRTYAHYRGTGQRPVRRDFRDPRSNAYYLRGRGRAR